MNFLGKLALLPRHRLSKRVMLSAFERDSAWAQECKSALFRYKIRSPTLPNADMERGARIAELNAWKREVYAAVHQHAEEKWRQELDEKPKLRLYRSVKQELQREQYIQEGGRAARALARLRTGSAELEVELGRWKGVAAEERLCMCCNRGVGSELHLLEECPALAEGRLRCWCNLCVELGNAGHLAMALQIGLEGGRTVSELRLGKPPSWIPSDAAACATHWAAQSAHEMMAARRAVLRVH